MTRKRKKITSANIFRPMFGVLALLVIGGMLVVLLGLKLKGLCKERWLKLGLGGVVSLIGVRYVLG